MEYTKYSSIWTTPLTGQATVKFEIINKQQNRSEHIGHELAKNIHQNDSIYVEYCMLNNNYSTHKLLDINIQSAAFKLLQQQAVYKAVTCQPRLFLKLLQNKHNVHYNKLQSKSNCNAIHHDKQTQHLQKYKSVHH